jgi:hypothetical protein
MKGPEPMTQTAARAFPLRRFAATRISQAIESDVRAPGAGGTVVGVHRSAVNIRWRAGLLTLAHEAMGGLPNGIGLDPPIALDQIGIVPGMRVESDGATLRLPGASISVFLAGAARWSPAMPVRRGLTARTRIDRAGRALALAADQAPRVGLGPLMAGLANHGTSVGSLGRAVARPLAEVLDALEQGFSDRAISAAFPLIGLGPGATPSGDDLLVGLAAGLAVTDHPVAGAFAAGVARDAAGLTTSVAESYLLHAGRLEFSERVHAAALAILDAPEAELRGAVNATLAWGATSGVDLLVGLLVGIQAGVAPRLADTLRTCADDGEVAA